MKINKDDVQYIKTYEVKYDEKDGSRYVELREADGCKYSDVPPAEGDAEAEAKYFAQLESYGYVEKSEADRMEAEKKAAEPPVI